MRKTRPPKVILRGVRGASFVLSEDTSPTSNGTVLALAPGAKGLGSPEYEVHVDDYPALDGGFVRSSRATRREIFLPIVMAAPTRAELVYMRRKFISALNPKLGLVQLITAEVNRAGNYEPSRYVECYYAQGMEGEEDEKGDLTWSKFGLVLRTTDPFFRDVNLTEVPFLRFENRVPFFKGTSAPFLGTGPDGKFLSSSGEFVEEVEVFNPGDIPVYPTWRLVGPMTGPLRLIRNAPGKVEEVLNISEDFFLEEGEIATLVTDPAQHSISSSSGNVLWSVLDPVPNFWTLEPGPNTVQIDGLNGVEPTSVSLNFRAGYVSM